MPIAPITKLSRYVCHGRWKNMSSFGLKSQQHRMIVMAASVLDRTGIFQSLSDSAKVAGISSVNLRIAAFSVIYSPEFFLRVLLPHPCITLINFRARNFLHTWIQKYSQLVGKCWKSPAPKAPISLSLRRAFETHVVKGFSRWLNSTPNPGWLKPEFLLAFTIPLMVRG